MTLLRCMTSIHVVPEMLSVAASFGRRGKKKTLDPGANIRYHPDFYRLELLNGWIYVCGVEVARVAIWRRVSDFLRYDAGAASAERGH